MHDKRILLITFSFSCIFFVQMAFSQTDHWKVSWNQNPESNISQYIIYRGNNETASTQIGQVNYPDTVFTDTDLTKGELIFYRVKARNTSFLESEYSEAESAAIPKIDFPSEVKNIVLAGNIPHEINLDLYVNDPDHADNLLTWNVVPSGNLLTINYNESNHRLSITTPNNWTTQEYIDLTATDPEGFYDVGRIGVFADSSFIPTPGPNIYAYPIPYKPSNSGGIVFANIPGNSTLYIYNFLGEPVFKASNITQNYVWDTGNDSGKEVASGLYIYYIKSKGKTTKGKLVIVR